MTALNISPQGYVNSYLLEREQGIHAWGTDVFKLALFSETAALGPTTTVYSTTNEITGTGYTAGGKTLALASGYPQLGSANDSAGRKPVLFDFDDVTWSASAFSWRYALIYNSSKSNRAVSVIDAGSLQTVASALTFAWPSPTNWAAIFRTAG